MLGGDTKARTWDPTMQSSNQSPLYAGQASRGQTEEIEGRTSLALQTEFSVFKPRAHVLRARMVSGRGDSGARTGDPPSDHRARLRPSGERKFLVRRQTRKRGLPPSRDHPQRCMQGAKSCRSGAPKSTCLRIRGPGFSTAAGNSALIAATKSLRRVAEPFPGSPTAKKK